MRKLRKNVHEKYTPLSLSPSHTHIFSLVLSLSVSHSFARTQTRTLKRENQGSRCFLWLFPLPCVKRNFLKLLDGSLPSSLLKADSRMEANYSETTTRESPRALFDYYILVKRFVPPVADFIGRIAWQCITLSAEAQNENRDRGSFVGEHRIDKGGLFRYEIRGNYLS